MQLESWPVREKLEFDKEKKRTLWLSKIWDFVVFFFFNSRTLLNYNVWKCILPKEIAITWSSFHSYMLIESLSLTLLLWDCFFQKMQFKEALIIEFCMMFIRVLYVKISLTLWTAKKNIGCGQILPWICLWFLYEFWQIPKLQ